MLRHCERCQTVFVAKSSGAHYCYECQRKMAIETAKRNAGKKKCPYCGEEFWAIYGAKHCSKGDCKKQHRLRRNSARWGLKKCPICGTDFVPACRSQKYCSVQCRQRHEHEASAARLALCESRARSCKTGTVNEFMRRFPADYKIACEHGVHFSFLKAEGNKQKITDAEIIAVARKYKTTKDFREKQYNFYALSVARGLRDSFTWLESAPGKFGDCNYVYGYFWTEQGTFYIGRSRQNPDRRDNDHRHNSRSSVFRFASESGIAIPKMVIIEEGLSLKDSQKQEDRYIKVFESAGLTKLNRAATGVGTGSVGAAGRVPKRVVKESAEQCKSLLEFRKRFHRYYRIAIYHGWLDEFKWLERIKRKHGTLTKGYCVRIANRYPSRVALLKADASVYAKIDANNWWKFTNLPQRQRLTLAYCKSVVDKYDSIKGLLQGNCSVYNKIQKAFPRLLRKFKKLRHYDGVLQYALDGSLVAKYKSIMEASRSTGIGASNIVSVCKGERHHTCGFFFKYVDDA